MNISTFTGNVGNVRSLKSVGSDSVLSFSVAVKNGFKKDTPAIWKECSIWGKRAESLSKYIEKGTSVTIVATETEDHWEKDGEKHSRFKYAVVEITLHPRGASQTQSNASPSNESDPSPKADDDIEEDVPF